MMKKGGNRNSMKINNTTDVSKNFLNFVEHLGIQVTSTADPRHLIKSSFNQ